MPAHPKLPHVSELVRLHREGHTYKEIGAMFGASENAVWKKLDAAGLTAETPRHEDLVPWTLQSDHAYVYPVVMLRQLSRRLGGATLTPHYGKCVDAWVAQMNRDGLCVYYHPDVPPNAASPRYGGFAYLPRRQGEGLVRLPAAPLRRKMSRSRG